MLGCAIVALLCFNQANAALITGAGSLTAPETIDFSQFAGGFTFTAGPIQIGTLVGEDVTWESSSSLSVIGDGNYGLGTNGIWNSGRAGYTGLNSDTAVMTYRFNDGPVNGVGGFMNYSPSDVADVFIYALDINDVVLESYNITDLAPISTLLNSTNDGAFRGILRASNDIYAFQLSNLFSVLDDLAFSRAAAVPEPGSLALLGLGLAGLGALRRRRR